MLQLHDIIENFPPGDDPEFVFLKNLILQYSDSKECPCFDFGYTGTVAQDLAEDIAGYANELFKHHLFTLPYNPVYYSWANGEQKYGIFVIQEDDKPLDLKILFFFARRNPFIFAGMGTIEYHHDVMSKDTEFGMAHIDASLSYINKRIKFVSDDSEQYLYRTIAAHTVILTSLLQSTHTKTRKTEYSDKLNKKRAKRGLPAIMPYHTVYFEVGGKNYNTDGTEVGSGTHASPKMHWRRGHVRKLASGKLTHVRPCLVNAMGLDVPVPKPKYELRVRKDT